MSTTQLSASEIVGGSYRDEQVPEMKMQALTQDAAAAAAAVAASAADDDDRPLQSHMDGPGPLSPSRSKYRCAHKDEAEDTHTNQSPATNDPEASNDKDEHNRHLPESEDHTPQSCPSRFTPLHRKLLVIFFFSFLSGWADTLAVIHFQTFAAMMTGNIIMLGVSLAPDGFRNLAGVEQPFWYFLIVIASSVSGAGIAAVIAQTIQRKESQRKKKNDDDAPSKALDVEEGSARNENVSERDSERSVGACTRRFLENCSRMTGLMTALFSLTMMLSGALLFHFTESKYSIIFFAAAMAAQNTFTASSNRIGVATAVMTSNTQKAGLLIATIVAKVRKRTDMDDIEWTKFTLPIFASLSTLTGAIFSGLLMRVPENTTIDASVFSVSQFVIAISQFGAYVLHDAILPKPSSSD